MFKKILIANRGEIACRVIKTAKKMNIKTVAVYSDADRYAEHVRMADETVYLGKSPASESYLKPELIIEACKDKKCDALHPGYGFLSENANFAEALDKADIVFIGPSKKAIASMGDKIESKKIAKAAEINTVPGYIGVIQNKEKAVQIADEIGYPVMIKASAGGGGKGMRIAFSRDEVADGFERATSEAINSFGDERIFIEKFITEPRHIEIQVLADKHGNTIYLGERECSIQRRNQKVIEEAPSPFLDEVTRKKMGNQAVKLAKKVGYSSAGTVEFIVDKNKNFYFLEMNTRLQVEHPVTEEAFDIDLVKYQIMVAAGYKIDLSNVIRKNHTIECRINAENAKDFSPSPGTVKFINVPGGRGVRIDTALYTNYKVNPHYDSLILKIVSKGKDRNESISIMKRVLDEIIIDGINTNIELHKWILNQNDFINGIYNTNWLEKNISKFN